jgi:hypothetical protein
MPPVQAISEVAVLTSSIAVTKAPAKAVAAWRLAEKVAVIFWSLFVFVARDWVTQHSMQGPCQIYFLQ